MRSRPYIRIVNGPTLDLSVSSTELASIIVYWLAISGSNEFVPYHNILTTSTTMLMSWSYPIRQSFDATEQQIDLDIAIFLLHLSEPSRAALRHERARLAAIVFAIDSMIAQIGDGRDSMHAVGERAL